MDSFISWRSGAWTVKDFQFFHPLLSEQPVDFAGIKILHFTSPVSALGVYYEVEDALVFLSTCKVLNQTHVAFLVFVCGNTLVKRLRDKFRFFLSLKVVGTLLVL